MKYSREQQDQHLEIITGILSEDDALSIRAVWHRLENKGISLDRAYVGKLVAQARMKWVREKRALRFKDDQIEVWEQEAHEIVKNFYQAISDHLANHP